jgi:hypothetical protein
VVAAVPGRLVLLGCYRETGHEDHTTRTIVVTAQLDQLPRGRALKDAMPQVAAGRQNVAPSLSPWSSGRRGTRG